MAASKMEGEGGSFLLLLLLHRRRCRRRRRKNMRIFDAELHASRPTMRLVLAVLGRDDNNNNKPMGSPFLSFSFSSFCISYIDTHDVVGYLGGGKKYKRKPHHTQCNHVGAPQLFPSPLVSDWFRLVFHHPFLSVKDLFVTSFRLDRILYTFQT